MFTSPSSSLSSDDKDDGDIVCIDLDASLNLEENVFKDLVESVFQRYLTEGMNQKEVDEGVGKSEHEIQGDDTQKNRKNTTRFISCGFLRRAKEILTCSTRIQRP